MRSSSRQPPRPNFCAWHCTYRSHVFNLPVLLSALLLDIVDGNAKGELATFGSQNLEDFEELATSSSDDSCSAAKGGDLGLVSRGVMVEPFENALFAMEEGAISDEPIKSRFGYHIIKLEQIEAERVKDFDRSIS